MITALVLFAVQAALGAWDTLYFHEWRARLAGGGAQTAPELVLHGARDMIYAVLFATLPFWRWEGLWVVALGALLIAEIALTLRDFVVEDVVRRPQGGVFAGERVMHAIMGIIYGAALAHLVPEMALWWHRPTGFALWQAPFALRAILPVMSLGVFVSGLRDLGAVYGPRWMRYPWGHR